MENIGIFCQAEALPYIASSSHLQWNYNGIKWYGWFMNGTILTYLKQYTILPVCSYLKWHYNGIKWFAIITPFVVPSTSACRKKSPPKIVEWIATREVAFYAAKKTLVAATLLTHPVNGAAIALCSLRNWVCSWLVPTVFGQTDVRYRERSKYVLGPIIRKRFLNAEVNTCTVSLLDEFCCVA